MTLEKDEYLITDDKVIIFKKALEECRDHYGKVSRDCHNNENMLQAWFYIGKRDLCVDLLKHFEPLEGE